MQKSVVSVFDRCHDTTRRLTQSITANEPVPHREVSYVGGEHLVGTSELQIAQQVRIDWMRRMAAGIGLLVQRFDTHLPHQRSDVLAANLTAFLLKRIAQNTAAGEWMLHLHALRVARGMSFERPANLPGSLKIWQVDKMRFCRYTVSN